jgi:2-hydroxy-3-keto-5-methylthiopentenyl-1-phosphate phosphatase
MVSRPRATLTEAPFTKTTLLSDFDGTISNIDTAQAALELFADPQWKQIDEALERGEVSFEDSLKEEFAMIRAPPETILKEVQRLTVLRPNFERLVDYCMANQIPLTVVSGGLDFCIQHFLNRDGWLKFIRIYAARSEFTGSGYALTFPKMYTPSSVNFKDDLVKYEKMNGKQVLYIGNGFGDYAAAKESDFAFAIEGSKLAELCRIRGVPHEEVDDFEQVIDVLKHRIRAGS